MRGGMAMERSTSSRGRSSDRAWKAVVSDWESVRGPKGDPRALSGSDIVRISGLAELDKRVKSAVSSIRSARRSLFSFREHFAEEADLKNKPDIDGKRIISAEKRRPLLARLLGIFDGVAFNVSNVRKSYNEAVPENVKEVVRRFGGKTFTRDAKTPSALLLASVPKGKEGKDLSIKTLMSGVDNIVAQLESGKLKYSGTARHEFRVVRSDNHIVLYRELDGVEQSIEMSFRRANKVDIFINGKATPSGSLYNDDALKTAEAFLRGKRLNFKAGTAQRQRFNEYVVVKDVEALRGA
jgi:hypothetical protein